MKKLIAVIVVALVALVWFFSGASRNTEWTAVLKSIRAKYPNVQQVSTDSLAAWLETAGEKVVLLDTRTPQEYAVSRIGEAINILPDASDFAALDSIPRNARIVAYCSVGYRSSEIASRLADAGFTNVSNLEGSIFKWANEGRPVNHESRPTSAVHPYNKVWGRLLAKDHRATVPAAE